MTYFEFWVSRTWPSSAFVDSSTSDASESSTRPSNSGSQKVARYGVFILDKSETWEVSSNVSEEPIVWLLVCEGVAKAPIEEVVSSLDVLEKSELPGKQDWSREGSYNGVRIIKV